MPTKPIDSWLTLGHQGGRETLTAPTGMSLLAALVATWSALLNSPLPAAQVAQSDTTSPVFELRKGERYFRIDGAAAFVLGRNPVGVSPEAFAEHLRVNADQLAKTTAHTVVAAAGKPSGQLRVIEAVVVGCGPRSLAGRFETARDQEKSEFRTLKFAWNHVPERLLAVIRCVSDCGQHCSLRFVRVFLFHGATGNPPRRCRSR